MTTRFSLRYSAGETNPQSRYTIDGQRGHHANHQRHRHVDRERVRGMREDELVPVEQGQDRAARESDQVDLGSAAKANPTVMASAPSALRSLHRSSSRWSRNGISALGVFGRHTGRPGSRRASGGSAEVRSGGSAATGRPGPPAAWLPEHVVGPYFNPANGPANTASSERGYILTTS